MPAAIIPAAISAGGAVAGGVASGKGAKKAAKIQKQSTDQQMALQRQLYQENSARFSSDIERGDAAAQRIMSMLGLPGGDGSDPAAIIRATPGYQFQVGEALRGVNTNAYARGLGNSGATQRALLKTGQNMADSYFNTYVNQASDVANRGTAGKGALAGVAQNFGTSANNISQNAANTASQAAIINAANIGNMIRGVAGAAGQAFGSSYGQNPATIFKAPPVHTTPPFGGGYGASINFGRG